MGKIFAGLLFVFLHFKINGFDLLPDFVGYLLIWRGMKSVPECSCWQTGWAAAAAIASAAMLGVSLMGLQFPGILGVGVNLVMTVLQLLVLYDIVRGAEELEQVTGVPLQADWLRKTWYIWMICVAVTYADSLLGFVSGIAFPAMVASFVCAVCYLVGVYRVWRAYDAWREEQRPAI